MTTPAHDVATALPWCRTNVVLNYYLGWLRVGRRRFVGAQVDCHFTQAPPWEGRPMPWTGLDEDIDLLLYSCWPVRKRLPLFERTADALLYVPTQYDHYYIDLQPTHEQYLATFSSRHRQTMRYKLRKLEKVLGGLNCRTFRSVPEVDECFGLANEIVARSYKHYLPDMELPDSPQFMQTVREQAQRGDFIGYVLYHDKLPISFSTFHVRHGIGELGYTAYDASYQQYSPGRCLLMIAIEEFFRTKPFSVLDFGHAGFDYKKQLSTQVQSCADIFCLKPTLANWRSAHAHRFFEGFSRSVARSLDKVGAKERILRWRRRRAAGKSIARARQGIGQAACATAAWMSSACNEGAALLDMV